MTDNSSSPGNAWLMFSLLTVFSWGVYGVFLHKGQVNMSDPVNGRYKAFLFVGVAYFITAVLAPLAVLMLNKAAFTFPAKGLWWSLIAGIVGAVGAFGVLLAFGAKGTPAVVMSIVFAGAPVVNAIYSIVEHPPAGGWSSRRRRAMCSSPGKDVTFAGTSPSLVRRSRKRRSVSIVRASDYCGFTTNSSPSVAGNGNLLPSTSTM